MKKISVIGIAALFAATLFAAPVTSSSGNNLSALGKVTISADKDYSKKNTPALKGATVEETEYLGEKCVKATKNRNNELRFAFMFETPVSAADLKSLKYSIAGMDGYSGHYNIGVMYEEMKGAEHNMSCYTSSYVKKDEWSTWTFDLKNDEAWGKNFSPDKKIIGIQFWSNMTPSIYLKDVSLEK